MIRDERIVTCQIQCNSTEGRQAWTGHLSLGVLLHHFCLTGAEERLPKVGKTTKEKQANSNNKASAKAEVKIIAIIFAPGLRLYPSPYLKERVRIPNNPKSKNKDIGLIRDKDLNACARGIFFSRKTIFPYSAQKLFLSGNLISSLLGSREEGSGGSAPGTNLCNISSRHEILHRLLGIASTGTFVRSVPVAVISKRSIGRGANHSPLV